MPDTYTKEQIDEAKLWLTTNDTGDSYDQKRRIGFEAIILSALDTAERERDENERKGKDLCTWVGNLMIERDRLENDLAERDQTVELARDLAKKVAKAEGRAKLLEAQVAELEARLQGVADRADQYFDSVGLYRDWTSDELRAAILGKKED